MRVSSRLSWAILGGTFGVMGMVFGVVWEAFNIGWAVVVLLCIIAVWLLQASCIGA